MSSNCITLKLPFWNHPPLTITFCHVCLRVFPCVASRSEKSPPLDGQQSRCKATFWKSRRIEEEVKKSHSSSMFYSNSSNCQQRMPKSKSSRNSQHQLMQDINFYNLFLEYHLPKHQGPCNVTLFNIGLKVGVVE